MSRILTWAAALLGVIFLAVPLAADAYSHHLQDVTFRQAQEKVLTCRAQLAMGLFDHPRIDHAPASILKTLDGTCGGHPRYDDFTPTRSGVLGFYDWLGQRVAFLPL